MHGMYIELTSTQSHHQAANFRTQQILLQDPAGITKTL